MTDSLRIPPDGQESAALLRQPLRHLDFNSNTHLFMILNITKVDKSIFMFSHIILSNFSIKLFYFILINGVV